MNLRWYQTQAVEACWSYLCKETGSPCVVLPTGSGKTPVIAKLCERVVGFGGRALVLAHVKELLQQNAEKIKMFVDPQLVGVYSAGLNERTTDAPIVVAGIQSVWRRAEELGAFQLVVVDEAHLIPPDGEGRYRTFLDAAKNINPEIRLVGLTATPYRLGCGWITKDRALGDGDSDQYDRLLDAIVYEVEIADLVAGGYLTGATSRSSSKAPDFSNARTTRGDFNEEDVEKVLGGKNVLFSICSEIVEKARDRRKVVVFCNRVESAKTCAKLIAQLDRENDVAVVDGTTGANDRAELIRRFKNEENADLFGDKPKPLKYVCNVGVLTTGFDAPNVDCVALLRPTKSLALYQQMVGRGLRISEGKSDCLVLDYGGNIERHGPIDLARPKKTAEMVGKTNPWQICKECRAVVSIAYAVCPLCGAKLREKKPNDVDPNAELDASASSGAILKDQEEPIVEDCDVDGVEYSEHYKKSAPEKAPSFQIKYSRGRYRSPVFEWYCPEHESSWVKKKFAEFWRAHSRTEPPESTATAVLWANNGALDVPTKIKTKRKPSERFARVEWLESIPCGDFDPAKIKDEDAEFFDEFGAFDDSESSPGALICKNCRSFYPEEGSELGFCWRNDKEMREDSNACEKFEDKPIDDDVPF